MYPFQATPLSLSLQYNSTLRIQGIVMVLSSRNGYWICCDTRFRNLFHDRILCTQIYSRVFFFGRGGDDQLFVSLSLAIVENDLLWTLYFRQEKWWTFVVTWENYTFNLVFYEFCNSHVFCFAVDEIREAEIKRSKNGLAELAALQDVEERRKKKLDRVEESPEGKVRRDTYPLRLLAFTTHMSKFIYILVSKFNISISFQNCIVKINCNLPSNTRETDCGQRVTASTTDSCIY